MAEVTDLMTLIQNILNGDTSLLESFSESPVDFVEANGGDATVDPTALVADALAGTDLDPATQAAVLEAVTASTGGYAPAENGGYTSDELADIFAQGINITVEEGDEIVVDNSTYVTGDVKGGIHQNNVTEITDADDGAIIANGAYDSNFQTGEGNVQLSDVDADNITTGDGNAVASGYSTIGDGNVDAGSIYNSEFGEGDQDRSADVDLTVTDSGNSEYTYYDNYSDDDVTETKLDLDVDKVAYGEPAPKPVYEPEYEAPKPVYEDAKPVYEEPVYEAPKPVYEEPKPVYEEPAYEPEPSYYEPKPEPTYEYDAEPVTYDVCD